MGYYDNVNPDLLGLADVTATHVLELGCGAGSLAEAYLARNPLATYTGIELDPPSIEKARTIIPRVIPGDIETEAVQHALRQACPEGGFDLLLIGDVLEHLRDPWAVVAFLSTLMSPKAQARICIPNVSHWSVILRQMRGDWTYTDSGLLDQTHLRFFTADSTADMFRKAGWFIDGRLPRIFTPIKGEKVVKALAKGLKALEGFPGVTDEKTLRRNLMPLQWVFALSRYARKKPLRIQAFGMLTEHDAMVEVRLARPLAAMTSTGQITHKLDGAKGGAPIRPWADVAWFYRTHLNSPAHAKEFADRGGLLILDVDDHPGFLPNHVKNDFLTLRGVHAVTTTTPKLAELLRGWNPEVHIFENTLLELPPERAAWRTDKRLHLVFAAINRTQAWKAQCGALLEYLKTHGSRFRATVLHDATVARDLSPLVETRFQRFSKYSDYLDVLKEADVVLMPLKYNQFNTVKSDLKIVETLAAGAVPIVSPAVQDLTTIPAEHYLLAETSEDWPRHLETLSAEIHSLGARSQSGRAYVAAHRMLAGQAEARAALLNDLRDRLPELEQARQTRINQWRIRRARAAQKGS